MSFLQKPPYRNGSTSTASQRLPRKHQRSNRISLFHDSQAPYPVFAFQDPGRSSHLTFRFVSLCFVIFRFSPCCCRGLCLAFTWLSVSRRSPPPRKGKSTRTLTRRIREDPPAHICTYLVVPPLPYLTLPYSALGTLPGILARPHAKSNPLMYMYMYSITRRRQQHDGQGSMNNEQAS